MAEKDLYQKVTEEEFEENLETQLEQCDTLYRTLVKTYQTWQKHKSKNHRLEYFYDPKRQVFFYIARKREYGFQSEKKTLNTQDTNKESED